MTDRLARAEPAAWVNVLVVDDQQLFRDLLGSLVVATGGFRIIGEAVSGEDAVASVAARPPDLVLMDVRMPGMGGVEAAGLLLERHPVLVIILMSAEPVELSVGLRAFLPRITCVRKQDIGKRTLQQLWRGCVDTATRGAQRPPSDSGPRDRSGGGSPGR